MPRVAADVPADSSILCEGCGYTLDGLPTGANCPECGKPVIESTTGDGRHPSGWERGSSYRFERLVSTTCEVIFRPSRFFRTLQTRRPLEPAAYFAIIHWFVAAVLFTSAARAHWWWFTRYIAPGDAIPGAVWVGMVGLAIAGLWGTTKLAAILTAWEARYRGIRLPKTVVLRGLYFHAAHYLPVALGALLTTWGNALLFNRGILGLAQANIYLILLSAEVILAAGYLFKTYWAAMRNMMYANR